MPKANAKQLELTTPKEKIFWPCGDTTGLGCGKECWQAVPHILTIKLPGQRVRNVVFCSNCAKKIKESNTLLKVED